MQKRAFALLVLMLVLLLTGFGCMPKQQQANVTLKEPPVLQLQYVIDGQKTETVISSGNYEWYYENADGTRTGDIACGAHPLDSATKILQEDGLTQLQIVFSTTPTNYSIRCWPDRCRGNAERYEQDASALAMDGNTLTLPANGEGYVYELSAEWPEGNASYSFYVTPA